MWSTTPSGVCIAIATESAIEWFVLTNSTVTFCNLILSLGLTLNSFVVANKPCSLSFDSTIPKVNFVPYTGTSNCFKTYGNAPIWSSCPWVKNIPLIFSLFFSK